MTTENLAQRVINGLISLRLTHFEGEDVVACIFTVRHVLGFLRYGKPESFAPRSTMTILFDIFRGTSVGGFRAHVQHLQDFKLKDQATPDLLFEALQDKYEELLLADRWVPTKKQKSSFVADTKSYAKHDLEQQSKQGEQSPRKQPHKRREPKTHDKSGKKIDRTPPKPGEPHKRTVDGVVEYWCATCGRWGSHPTKGHDEWLTKFREDMKKKRAARKQNEGADKNDSTNSGDGKTRASVTFCQAVMSGATQLRHDSELEDGIDIE